MKRLQILVLAAVVAALMLTVPGTAFAESQQGSNWSVTYTSGGQLDDDFKKQEYIDNISGLQPGDDITFTVTLKNENDKAADWYMSNQVKDELEKSSKEAEGSAYEYLLTYNGAGSNASRTLYDSQAVGGDNSDGLKEATQAGGLEDYFFLENLSKGQSGTVTLKVTLDGETEGNAYTNTFAHLNMKFGVDPSKSNDNPPNNNVVRTGDETNLFPFYVIMAVSGLALLVIAIVMIRRRRAEQTGGSHAR